MDVSRAGLHDSVRLSRHTVGPQNQIAVATTIGYEEFEQTFDYDANGRPVRIEQGRRREAAFGYDELSRLTDVYLDGEHVLTSDHGPMDVDPVHEADAHTPFTTVDQPVASAVFGSLEEIAFTRTAGTPYGFVRFVPTMARFVIRDHLIAPPDAVVLASLKRRNLASRATLNPSPLVGFDKASSSLFIPPEYFSVNCVVCFADAIGFDLDRVGSGDVPVGQQVDFVADANYSECWLFVWDNPELFLYHYEDSWWKHEIRVNGAYVTTLNGPSGDYNHEYLEFGLTFWTPGTKTVRDTIRCAGCPSLFSTQAEEEVDVCDPEGDAYDALRDSFWGPRASLYVTRYDFLALGNTFYFETLPGSDTPSLQSDVESSYTYWNISKANGCGTVYNIVADEDWSDADSRNIIYETAGSLGGNCGVRSTIQVEGQDYDFIQVLSSLPGSCGPRAELFAHELGHVLGFWNAGTPFDSDIMRSPRVGTRSVEAHHSQVLLYWY